MNDVMHHTTEAESVVILSEAAKNHLLAYLEKDKALQGVRFSVKTTGCFGLSYVIENVKSAVTDDIVMPLNDHYNLYIAKKSLPFLKGVTIDYVKDGLTSKLVFTNPNQTGECGCGESFTVNSEN